MTRRERYYHANKAYKKYLKESRQITARILQDMHNASLSLMGNPIKSQHAPSHKIMTIEAQQVSLSEINYAKTLINSEPFPIFHIIHNEMVRGKMDDISEVLHKQATPINLMPKIYPYMLRPNKRY